MINLKKEEFGKVAKAANNFWVIATRHRPGLSRHMFEINNRCLLFQLKDKLKNEEVLVVVNAVDPNVIPEVRKIEKETGLRVKYILSPGGGHHMMLPRWYEEFKQAEFLLPPERIPNTRTGKKLVGKPRVKLMDANDPLPQFKGQLEAVLFSGILGSKDIQAPGEGAGDTVFHLVRNMILLMTQIKTPIDELWLYHVPTKTVIGGENLSWFYTKEELAKQPFMLKGMIKPDILTIQNMRKVWDKDKVKECWKKILSWPSDTVMTYHELPGYAYFGNGQEALREAVIKVKQI